MPADTREYLTSPSNSWFTFYFNGHSQYKQLFTELAVTYSPHKVDIIFHHHEKSGKWAWSFAPWYSGVHILPHFQRTVLMWKQLIFCIPSASPSRVLGINTAFFLIQQLQSPWKAWIVGAQSFLIHCATKSMERLHWTQVQLNREWLRMPTHRNNGGISPQPVSAMTYHSRHGEHSVQMLQVLLVAFPYTFSFSKFIPNILPWNLFLKSNY